MWLRWCSGCRRARLWGRAAWCARGRWPAREPSALRSARRLEAWPGLVPRSVPYPQFRMQFPDTCSSSLSEKPGILTITFQSMKCAQGNCMRMCADRAPPPPTGTAAWPAGPSGALHTGGAVSLTCACASARCPARPRHCPLISHVIPLRWSGLVLWTGCFEGCWLLLVVLCPLACVLVG